MKNNLRTAGLIAAGMISGTASYAEEAVRMHPVETALTATTISGYVSTSAFFNMGEDDGGTALPGRSFDGANKVNQINLDVVKLSIEKPLDDTDWAAGYKVDLLFGPDANTLATTSWMNEANSDFGVKQAYVALQSPIGNGLVAKIGVFDTIIGYEVFESGNNPNYSRSYGYYIEPTQHTGLLLSYAVNDWLTVNAGIADAWNARINAPGAEGDNVKDYGLQTYLGSVAITLPPDGTSFLKGTTIYGGVVHGLGSSELEDADPRTSLYAGITVPTPLVNLAVGMAFDYRVIERDVAGWENDKDDAAVFAGYVTYKFNEQIKASLRGEYANGSSGTWGTRTAGDLSGEELFGLTATLDYNLWAGLLTRLEFRWDSDLADGTKAFGGVSEPEANAYILGLNVLYKF